MQTIHSQSKAKYVGSSKCSQCHQQQYNAWQGSHHDMSMRHANAESVLADFNDVTLEFNNKTNRFFKKDQEYWVNIEGADGQFHDYQIKYTFGFEPLQQYMVELDNGHIQLIPFAWDSRPKAEQGQRWFNLYPNMTAKHQEFHWLNTGQNWNFMCADCHSTHVKKNFNVQNKTYNTTFSEINVACEACHGPASEHIVWSETQNKALNNPHEHLKNKHRGFDRDLTKSVNHWVSKKGKSTLLPEKIEPSKQVLVCAQCHSRHTQISHNDHVASGALGDRYLLNLIDPDLYYSDGQVYQENFVFGSFLQSKMSQQGVVCSNCHDPHSAKLVLPKSVVCLQCHQASTYQNTSHHHHEVSSTGAQCINCHMPETTYMQIDGRRDHRWHVPNPQASAKFSTPDVCLSCHKDKNSHWSSQQVSQWSEKKGSKDNTDFTAIFYAADRGYPNISEHLSKLAQNHQYTDIIRASAISRLGKLTENNNPNIVIAISRAVKSGNEFIRVAAAQAARALDGHNRWRVLSPLLSDKVLAVRIETAATLVPLWFKLSASQKQQLQKGIDEYLQVQAFNADRGFSHVNKANVLASQGKLTQAEESYLKGIEIDPYFAVSYLNLADFYRQQQEEPLALKTLQKGFKLIPDNADLAYSLGLALIRSKQPKSARQYLEKATLLAPTNANFFYVFGLSLAASDNEKAQVVLDKAYQISNNPQHLFALCDMQVKIKSPKARQCIEKLSSVAPQNVISSLYQKLNH